LKVSKSIAELVMESFPGHAWEVWRFVLAPRGHWTRLARSWANQEPKAMEEVEHWIDSLVDKYKISKEDRMSWRNSNVKLESIDATRLALFGGINAILDQRSNKSTTSVNVSSDSHTKGSQFID